MDAAEHQASLAFGVARDASSMIDLMSVVRMKWAKYRTFGRSGGLWMIDRVDETGQSQYIRKKDKFLLHVRP